jgi:hypothetical protein
MNSSYWDSPSYGKVVWAVRLSNGEVYYQDDTEEVSWVKLRKYLKDNNLTIKHLGLKSFDNEVWTPEEKDGYYFSNGAVGFMGGPTVPTKNIGYVENERIYLKTYRCPELLVVEEDERELIESDYLICNRP